MPDTDTRLLAEHCIEAINRREYDSINLLVTDDVQLRLPPGQVFRGPSGVREFFEHLDHIVPSLTLAISRVYSGPDFAVVEWWSSGATPAGSETESLGVAVLQVEGDRVSRIQIYLDTAEWERLGG